MFFAVDKGVDVVGGQLKSVAMCNCVRRTRFYAVAAENAARVVDVIYAGVAFARGNAVGIGIFRRFDVNAIRRASRSAKEATYAFLEAGFVAMEDVNSAVASLKMDRLVRIVLGHGLAEHILERDAETLHQGRESFADFSKNGRHD